jgi:hypothetical protein
MPGNTRDYVAIATPVTSAQMARPGCGRTGGLRLCRGLGGGKNVGDLVMSGKDALNLPRRLEPLHDPLSSSGWLMGVFGSVIEALVLPMLDRGQISRFGSGVALQLVGDEHTRGSSLLLEELAEQTFGGLLVAPALDENIETKPSWSTARQSQGFFPATLMTTSSRRPCRRGEALADGSGWRIPGRI